MGLMTLMILMERCSDKLWFLFANFGTQIVKIANSTKNILNHNRYPFRAQLVQHVIINTHLGSGSSGIPRFYDREHEDFGRPGIQREKIGKKTCIHGVEVET